VAPRRHRSGDTVSPHCVPRGGERDAVGQDV
jgi:hypothetical protein